LKSSLKFLRFLKLLITTVRADSFRASAEGRAVGRG